MAENGERRQIGLGTYGIDAKGRSWFKNSINISLYRPEEIHVDGNGHTWIHVISFQRQNPDQYGQTHDTYASRIPKENDRVMPAKVNLRERVVLLREKLQYFLDLVDEKNSKEGVTTERKSKHSTLKYLIGELDEVLDPETYKKQEEPEDGNDGH